MKVTECKASIFHSGRRMMNTQAKENTVMDYLSRWAEAYPEQVWLRDRKGDTFTEWTWRQARDEIHAVAAWLESQHKHTRVNCAILSRNRAHWILADMAIMASGNVSVPLFTTLPAETADYIVNFSEVELLFLGESDNWDQVSAVVPGHVQLVALPGVEPAQTHLRWEDITQLNEGRKAKHHGQHDELISIVFTSGTTGVPKGVMQTHDSMLIPMDRCQNAFSMRDHPRFLSYLPLSHVAERQVVWIQSLIFCGEITFNEALPTLVRDMAEARPTYFYGAPRIWEQLQQLVVDRFGSQRAMDKALEENAEATVVKARSILGLQDTDYLLTGAAPSSGPLIAWFERLGLVLMDGYGQTEAMGLIANRAEQRRSGSIGQPIEGVEVRIAESGELMCKAAGVSPGYYKMPEKTAETFVEGWVHTGDKARVDEDGFYYITGRIKDYFKTIHGKFVAPYPLEEAFANKRWVNQQCLLGRGYSKTVMVCILSADTQSMDRDLLEQDLRSLVEEVNRGVEKHARVGAVIISDNPWTIENAMLTPTLKIKRGRVEERYGERARALAHQAAVRGEVLIQWDE
jgi:long-chain acyl-CoA synthetase